MPGRSSTTTRPRVATQGRAPDLGLIGNSPAMRDLAAVVARVARFKTHVLLLGESGAGKELVARAIHDAGVRKGGPFVPVNCATLGKELLENELFGHERGAFTGAHSQKQGLFELAHGGTLFLDEIGDMERSTQAKLLRVLERSELRRVGGTVKLKFDANVVAATNQDLRRAVADGRFREDLFYRLRVVTIVVPPLRDHREDIPALVEAFLREFVEQHEGEHERQAVPRVTPQAMRLLVAHDWPGNVRELKNEVVRVAMLTDDDLLDAHHFADLARDAAAPSVVSRRSPRATATGADDVLQVPLPARLVDVERALVHATLSRTPNRRRAARELGIGLRTLYTKLREYGERGD